MCLIKNIYTSSVVKYKSKFIKTQSPHHSGILLHVWPQLLSLCWLFLCSLTGLTAVPWTCSGQSCLQEFVPISFSGVVLPRMMHGSSLRMLLKLASLLTPHCFTLFNNMCHHLTYDIICIYLYPLSCIAEYKCMRIRLLSVLFTRVPRRRNTGTSWSPRNIC